LRTRESAFLLSLLFSFQRPNGPTAGSRPPAARGGDGKIMYPRAKVNKKTPDAPDRRRRSTISCPPGAALPLWRDRSRPNQHPLSAQMREFPLSLGRSQGALFVPRV